MIFSQRLEIFLLHRSSTSLQLHIYAVRNLRGGAGLHPSSIALPLSTSVYRREFSSLFGLLFTDAPYLIGSLVVRGIVGSRKAPPIGILQF